MGFTTNKTLIQKVVSGEEISWNDFYKTYAPLIVLHGKDYHLRNCELKDLVLDVMYDFFKKGSTFVYNPKMGKFRNYMREITRRCALKIISQRTHTLTHSDEDVVDNESDFEKKWDEEYQTFLLEQVSESIRERCSYENYQIYSLNVLQGISVEEVSQLLHVTKNTVYLMRFRVARMLQEIVDKNINDISGRYEDEKTHE